MSATKAKNQTSAAMPSNVPTKEYRLYLTDYPSLQHARNLSKLQKLKTCQYTREDDGLQDLRITFKHRDTVFTAETLTEWGIVLGEQILEKIEKWTPTESVYQLSEMFSTMKFCNPALEVDLTTLPTAKIPKKLTGLVQIMDNAGWGRDKSGAVVNCDEILQSIEAAERLGMAFTKE